MKRACRLQAHVSTRVYKIHWHANQTAEHEKPYDALEQLKVNRDRDPQVVDTMQLLPSREEQVPSTDAVGDRLGLSVHHDPRVLLVDHSPHLLVGEVILLACVRLPVLGLSAHQDALVHLCSLVDLLGAVPRNNLLATRLVARVER